MTDVDIATVLAIHEEVIAFAGGSTGLRDHGLLEAAVAAPFQTFSGEDLFPTLHDKAARLAFGIIKNRPFVDGNKRTGAAVMGIFLEVNGILLSFSQRELIDIITSVADGSAGYEELSAWIRAHVV